MSNFSIFWSGEKYTKVGCSASALAWGEVNPESFHSSLLTVIRDWLSCIYIWLDESHIKGHKLFTADILNSTQKSYDRNADIVLYVYREMVPFIKQLCFWFYLEIFLREFEDSHELDRNIRRSKSKSNLPVENLRHIHKD